MKQYKLVKGNRHTTNWFSGRMKRVLNREENLSKPHWRDEPLEELCGKLLEKAGRLQENIDLAGSVADKKSIIEEAIHVANYAMMIADNAQSWEQP